MMQSLCVLSLSKDDEFCFSLATSVCQLSLDMLVMFYSSFFRAAEYVLYISRAGGSLLPMNCGSLTLKAGLPMNYMELFHIQ